MSQFTPSSDIAVGSASFKFHSAGAVTGVQYDAIIVMEDAVFTKFEVSTNGNASVEELTTRGMNGRTLKAGLCFLNAGKGKKITAFTTSSGVVQGFISE